MFGTEQIMAILLEAEDLRQVHRTWPQNMRLAVCLMPSGDCQLLLFRQEEISSFPQRLRKHLGLRPEELSIYPPVPGFPSRAMKYSDERSLAALLADSPGLLEDAHDYSVNFSYALEEGLDPVEFLGFEASPDRGQVMPEPAAPTVAGAAPIFAHGMGADQPLQFASRRQKPAAASPAPRNLRFDLVREAQKSEQFDVLSFEAAEPATSPARGATPVETPGAAFISADQLISLETPPGSYQLQDMGDWITLTRGAGATFDVLEARSLYLRDDHKLVAIAVPGLTEMPANLRIASDGLPDVLRNVLRGAAGDVHLTLENGYAYVTLPVSAPKAGTAPTATPLYDAAQAEKTTEKPTRGLWASLRRARGMRLLALTTATTLAIFLIMSAVPSGTGDQKSENSKVDWSQFRLSMQTGSF